VFEVIITSPTQGSRTWTLPRALLFHHPGYFRRADRFKEGEEKKIEIKELEPTIFKLFV
jgi:hypothetical protein